MSITSYALKNKLVVHLFLVLILLVGSSAFFTLGKKEDAPFVMKTAVLMTSYPGASPEEVEELVLKSLKEKYRQPPESSI